MTYVDMMNRHFEESSFELGWQGNLVYMALLQIWNMCGRRHSFTASDRQIGKMVGMNCPMVRKGRKELIEHGLITYSKSNQIGIASEYTLGKDIAH